MTAEERLQKGKIPCEETGISVRHTICDICSPGIHCGVDAYVKDGELIKLEGTKGFVPNQGALCAKGASGRQYATRPDRIREPMRRVGPRGSGKFEPVSWDEAFALAAKGLNDSKERYGAEATVFLSGYAKWYRTFLHRLAYSFGSPNYLSESSACWWSAIMASQCVFGHSTMADMQGTNLLIIWGTDPFTKNAHLSKGLFALKERGGRIIVVDPRRNAAAEKLADIYLRPRLGTDVVLASAMANHIIRAGLADMAFIEKYVHGFEQYRDYVSAFDLETAERMTGVPADDIRAVAEEFATTKPASMSTGTGLTHRLNGFNCSRALMSLAAICGQFDRPGTLKPGMGPSTFCYSAGGFQSREGEFINSVKPKGVRATVGLERFPLFAEKMNEGQSMDLAGQILSGQPYPIKSAFLAGVNHMMYPNSPRFLQALRALDFTVASDIFWTETCRNADIVLPACTSYERAEIKCYFDRFIYYTQPAVEPMYNSRSDTDIFCGLAKYLCPDDKLLCAGYDACARFMLEDTSGIKDWEAFRRTDHPTPAPAARPYKWGTVLERGPMTPTRKIELYSETIAAYGRPELNPLPIHVESCDNADPEVYPFVMCSGTRNSNSIHSRLHKCDWPRSLRPTPSVDVNPADAKRLGIAQNEPVELSTPVGSITVEANITLSANIGELHMAHGYEEADVNRLIGEEHLDPYTGFPGYKQYRCRLTKKV